MGSIIGRGGARIKSIQDNSGVRMVAGKEMLPQSTERIVEITGGKEGVEKAVREVGGAVMEDWERGIGTVLYNPASGEEEGSGSGGRSGGGGGRYVSGTSPTRERKSFGAKRGENGDYSNRGEKSSGGYKDRSLSHNGTRGSEGAASSEKRVKQDGGDGSNATGDGANLRTQHISIPADMVGCIIGRGGSNINEIRKLSGSRITIASEAHDDSQERMFTITGVSWPFLGDYLGY
jgi:heterogeneous nuclear rnp K-like protein